MVSFPDAVRSLRHLSRLRQLDDEVDTGLDMMVQVFGGGMAVMIDDVRAQPAPQRLDRHQVRTVAGQWREGDVQAAAADQTVLAR